jgi:hypothetical protein
VHVQHGAAALLLPQQLRQLQPPQWLLHLLQLLPLLLLQLLLLLAVWELEQVLLLAA